MQSGVLMGDLVAQLFEEELRRRDVTFRIDPDSQRYVIGHGKLELKVSLENLRRTYEQKGDAASVVFFVDTVLRSSSETQPWTDAQTNVFFCLEPANYAEKSELCTAVSDLVDRVPVCFDPSRNTMTWVTSAMLNDWQVSLPELTAQASENLANALSKAELEHSEIDGMRLGWLTTKLFFKSALILAPNLKQVVSPILGWPLLAVVPDRDFLYLWDARHQALVNRVGGVVVKEFNAAPYPLSTEVFSISDNGTTAIGAFPTEY
jgi:hypothetical protein